MATATAAITTSMIQESFNELEKQRELIANCTILWKELSDHFTSLEKDLQLKAELLKTKRQTLDLSTQETLISLHRREQTIDSSVDLAISNLDSLRESAISALSSDPEDDLASKLRSLCKKMDSEGFLDLIVSKRKEVDVLRSEIPAALSESIDPAKLVLDAISRVFPVDRRTVKSPLDLAWACVLILEGLVPALADPELGKERLLVTGTVKERARAMVAEWKEGRGGAGSLKPADVHTFLQHLVTFGVAEEEDRELYQKLVVGYAWRKQMPKLAVSLGLEDRMSDIIEELIGNGQQLDAINFAYEAGLQNKFPPVPLLKSFLGNSKKVAPAVSEDQNNSGQAADNARRRKQAALRAVIKCVEERKLEAEFPLEDLQKRLENMEKAKVEKKKSSGGGGGSSGGGSSSSPANKRTRANSGGPMPPAKAGRLTNHAYVSSSPAAPTYIRSPSSYTTYSAIPPSSHSSYPPSHTTYSSTILPYPYDRPAAHSVYGSRSPQATIDPYTYPTEEVAPAAIGMSYTSAPMNYPPYGGYGNGLAPGYQQAYYR